MTTLTTLLIANRGEIACRVMRTARALGIRTVAVYSTADANALHVREADDARWIGPAPVAESYLNIDAILAAAAESGADAIHPGYGFLSENAAFAQRCRDAGLCLVGPPVAAIDIMGDKARAKRAMLEAGVPCVPGYQGEDQAMETLLAEAEAIGLPLMVKAAAGGGGRGMRLVERIDQLPQSIAMAQSEAENAFGSRALIIEKAILRPRHVEIQVFADQQGNAVFLGERDCSIQRRHQKVVEEAPCPVMTPSLREAMGAAAVNAARAVDYMGAGTVEFLLDADGQFYFLEMNTRLQVEHPVTELVTGFDLVEWQLRVARGEPLPARQEDIELFGHAIEVRLYAEDPRQGFLPATGPVHHFSVPDMPGVRVDTGVASGDEVSPFYDAMVAKVMAVGETREDARLRLRRALQSSALFGVANNRDFLIDVLAQPTFVAGEATTAFIADHYGDAFADAPPSPAVFAMAAVIQHTLAREQHRQRALSVSAELLDWCSTGAVEFHRAYRQGEETVSVSLRAVGSDQFAVALSGETLALTVLDITDHQARLAVDGQRTTVLFHADDCATLHLATAERCYRLIDVLQLPPDSAEKHIGGNLAAPMHGLLLSMEVSPGDQVVQGQRLAVLEAMKMQHELIASVAGVVTDVVAAAGQQVAAGDLLLTIEES